MKFSKTEKKQLWIYTLIAFGITYLLGILMWYGYTADKALNVFPNAQMLYPAAGVMILLIATKKRQELPMRFFVSYLIVTALLIIFAVTSVFISEENEIMMLSAAQMVLIVGSMICGILLLTEKKEKRFAFGLRSKNGTASVYCIGLFLLIYVLRIMLVSFGSGGMASVEKTAEVFADPFTWIMLVTIVINFFFSYIAFFGEEYGWRYYLQPTLQKRYGKRIGVIILGVVWGLWHLPIDFFYYTSPDMGGAMLASQIVTCITLGIFFAYAYMKTENIWVPVILHFLNNNLVMVFSGDYTAEVLENQVVGWGDVLLSLFLNGVIFGIFLFTKEFRKEEAEGQKA